MPENISEYSSHNEGSLIKEKINPNTKIAIVEPVYAEYDNGNIFRLIEAFSKQTATSDEFEVICVVNNSPDVARAQNNAFLENQDTLELEDILAGREPIPEHLNEYRKQVLERAKAKKLALRMVDLSTSGIEKNIGRIRDIGLQEASLRFMQNRQGDTGIIAQLDADTVVEPKYVEKVLQGFSDDSVDSLFVHLDYFTPEGTEELFATSFHHQFKIAFDQWLNTLGNGKVEVGGPQTVARVRAYKQVGGIKHQDMAEDFVLAGDLSQNTAFKFGTNIRVYTADRARAEGYDAQMRLDRMQDTEYSYKNEDEKRSSPRIMFLREELTGVLAQNPEIINDEARLKSYFDKYHLPFDYALLRDKMQNPAFKIRDGKERPIHQQFSLNSSYYFEAIGAKTSFGSNEYVDEAVVVLKEQIDDQEGAVLDNFIRENSARARIRLNQTRTSITECVNMVFQQGVIDDETLATNPKTAEFLERNPWFTDKVNSLPEQFGNSDEALEQLKQEFPEYLEDFDNSRLRRSTALLHALTLYVREARNKPNEFPDTVSLLNRTKRNW